MEVVVLVGCWDKYIYVCIVWIVLFHAAIVVNSRIEIIFM